MKAFILIVTLTLFFNLNAQVVNWSTETGLAPNSCLVDGQVIPNFAGTGISVTVNVGSTEGGCPRINDSDPTKINIFYCDGCYVKVTTSGSNTLDVRLNNFENLL